MKAPASDHPNLVQLVTRALAAKQGHDIRAYDLRGQALFCDYIVIATALNAPQLKALGNAVSTLFKARGLSCFRQSGRPDSGWIMADYLDVIVHLFLPPAREYYGLDQLLRGASTK